MVSTVLSFFAAPFCLFQRFGTRALACSLLCAVPAAAVAQGDPVSQVNPFVGTETSALKDNGNTVPGATLPFGMLYWSPDPADPAPDSSGMYRYENPTTRGFSLMHLSGPGCGVYGDVPLFPMLGVPEQSPSALPLSYSAGYRHEDETAQPGYYAVKLNTGIEVKIAAELRSGLAEIRFPAGADRHTLLLDLSRNLNQLHGARLQIAGDKVSGSVSGGGFCGLANRYTVFFALETEEQPESSGTFDERAVHLSSTAAEGPRVGGYLAFSPKTEVVHVRVGLSFVSTANAEKNLEQEIPGWKLETVRLAARARWTEALGHAVVSGGRPEDRTVYYTALYHALLHPSVFSDTNGEYLGFDEKVHHTAPGHVQYANLSGWDIYRNQVQLITMFYPEVGSDIAQSLVNDAEQGGGLPIWPVANDESSCMVGDPSDLILASIYAFGGRDFDTAAALKAMVRGATDPAAHVRLYPERPGLASFLKLGYVPETPSTHGSASVTLEDENADFAIGEFAAALGDKATAQTFHTRAAQWRKLFDPGVRYIRPRDNKGNFLAGFTPENYEGFVEGNAAQYTWMIPYALPAVIQAIGGDAAVNKRLDGYFSQYGSYQLNRGPFFYIANEPSFGNPWIYNWTGAPARTQEVVRKTLRDLFHPTPAGLPGNDDLGATSAWIVFSQLGLYPEVPGVAGFTLNSPTFPEATLHFGSHTLRLKAAGAPEKLYISAVQLDGRTIRDWWIPWKQLQGASSLDFSLSARPSHEALARPPL